MLLRDFLTSLEGIWVCPLLDALGCRFKNFGPCLEALTGKCELHLNNFQIRTLIKQLLAKYRTYIKQLLAKYQFVKNLPQIYLIPNCNF